MVHSAVCMGEGNVTMTANGKGVSGQVDAISASLRKQFGAQQGSATVQVPCRSLDALMDSAGLRDATLLSLDVEGAEPIVVQAVQPSRFQMITVEADGREPAKDSMVRRRLLAAGLKLAESLWFPIGRTYVSKQADDPVGLAYSHDETRQGPFGPGGIGYVRRLHELVRKYSRLMAHDTMSRKAQIQA